VRIDLGKVGLFTGLTLAGSYLLALPYGACGGTWRMPDLLLLTAAYMLIPAAVAVLVQGLAYQQPLFGPLGFSFRPSRWFLVAWLLPPLLALAALPVSLLFPGVQYAGDLAGLFDRLQTIAPGGQVEGLRALAARSPGLFLAGGLWFGLLAGPTSNAVFGLGEEVGWRGFLQRELAPLGFWGTSAVTGLVWGIWHAPIILFGPYYPQHPVLGVAMMTGFTLLIAPLFSYVRLKSGSVLAAAVLHGSCNATGWLSVSLVRGGDDLTTGLLGLPGLIVLAVVDLALLIEDRVFARPDRKLDALLCGVRGGAGAGRHRRAAVHRPGRPPGRSRGVPGDAGDSTRTGRPRR
jgi:membrane protease YdiL (CAAX protease family)